MRKKDVNRVINQEQLIKEISEMTNLNDKKISKILDAMTTVIGNSLIQGNNVELSEFGIFEVTQWKSRRIVDISTGLERETNPVNVVRFRPIKELRDAIK